MQGHVCDRLVVHLEGPVETDQRGEMKIVLYELRLRVERKRTLQSEPRSSASASLFQARLVSVCLAAFMCVVSCSGHVCH